MKHPVKFLKCETENRQKCLNLIFLLLLGNRLRLFGVITKSLGRTKMNVINISVLLLGIMVVLMIVTCHSLSAHQQDSEEGTR